MRKLLWLLFFPLVAQAAGEGAWQASGMGITLNHRGQSASSSPLTPSQPVSGLMTLVAWRYELNGQRPRVYGCVYVLSPAVLSWTGKAGPPTDSIMFPPSNRCILSGKYPVAVA